MRTASARNRFAGFFLFLMFTAGLFGSTEIFLHWRYPQEIKPLKPQGWAIIPEASWIEYHPVLGWFHRKNRKAVLKKNGKESPLTTNSLGLRGSREYSVEKPAGTYRVYAAGDSFTFGFGVLDNEVFTHDMETAHPNWEIFNLGVAGYGVDQIRLLLKTFDYAYKPDAVILLIYPEDFWRATRAFNDGGYGKPFYKLKRSGEIELMHVPVPREKNFSAPQFPVFMEPSAADRLFAWSRWYVLGKKAVMMAMKKTGKEDPDSSPEWRLGRAILKDAVNEIRQKTGARIILTMVPPQRWLLGTVEPVRDSMARFAEREKIEFLDLTPVFKNALTHGHSIDEFYIPDDLHWTAEGHALVAQTLSLLLERESAP